MNHYFRRLLITIAAAAALVSVFAISASATLRGDIDNNGSVTSEDARLCLRCAVALQNFTENQMNIADMDMNLLVEADDARTILRTAVGLEDTVPYFQPFMTKAPTCTKTGEYTRHCTDLSVNMDGVTFKQEIPALGHDFSVLTYIYKAGSCSAQGDGLYKCVRCSETLRKPIVVEHQWAAATCTAPKTCKVCGITEGTALGHTTQLGYCSRCGEYQRALLSVYRYTMMPALNSGASALNQAYKAFLEKESYDRLHGTTTLNEVKQLYTNAYSYYYKAYTVCGDYKEFAEAKKVLHNICTLLMQIMYSDTVTVQNYSEVATLINSNTIFITGEKGCNYQLKQVIDSWKENENPAPVNPTPATHTDAEKQPKENTDTPKG